MIRKRCSSSGLKAVPHIYSKIHIWKKTYGTLLTMLTHSGFEWNATNNTLDAKDDAFENYAKSDPFAHLLRYKSFPFYDEWCEVFGKDRATGEHAEDIVSAYCNVTSNPIPHPPEYYVTSPDPSLFGDDIELMNSFTIPWAKTLMLLTLREVVQRGERTEAYESSARKQVWFIVEGVTELSIEQKCWVSKKLVNNKADLDLFLTMSNDARVAFMKMMADGKV
ncbi:UNVERIFIED_CONTAM: hypothetical protein Slati_4174300 [Sesamum latifolium]|uniref:Myb/SANT-like domain-containing protein n=1 Tax=Sesamum latifolium TaxID=2727402 RepID=A0AAW2T9J8_9LAMI